MYQKQKFTRLDNDFSGQPQQSKDDLYKFKKTIELSKPYEIYLETEKAYQAYSSEGKRYMDPMETLAQKTKKDLPLDLTDLQNWVTYNFLVLKPEEQAKIQKLNERQVWFHRKFQLLVPPIWFGCFAIYKYQLKLRLVSNFLVSCGTIYTLSQLGLYSSNRDMKEYYSQLYDEYKFEVLSPKHRGKKLFGGKKVYQVDQLEFTSSNFDDLKILLHNQSNK